MKVSRPGNNEVVLTFGPWSILFSYSTPVAAHQEGVGFFKTDQFHSVTTSKHINKWMKENGAGKPQSFFDSLKDNI